jgi:hypothetical protein
MNTTLDLFEAATVSLTRPTSMKERLAHAYLNYLSHVHENDLPTDVCEEFRALTDTLTRVSPELRGDDALRATIRKMSTDDAAAAAAAVVRMFGAVSRASALLAPVGVEEPVAAKGLTNVVPLHVANG